MFSAWRSTRKGSNAFANNCKEGTVVLLPSHKSNMDGLALAWTSLSPQVAAPTHRGGRQSQLLSVGALRRAGFLIRRTFAGDRCTRGGDAYVRRLIIDGWPLEFFRRVFVVTELCRRSLDFSRLCTTQALAVPTDDLVLSVSISYERFVKRRIPSRACRAEKSKRTSEDSCDRLRPCWPDAYGRLSIQFGKADSAFQVLPNGVGNSRRRLTFGGERSLRDSVIR